MNKLTFKQANDRHGSCACDYNGKIIDHCDMNFERRYTQAHIVVAKLIRTLGHGNFEIEIIPCDETIDTVGIYPIGDIVEMASYIKDQSNSIYDLK